MTKSELRSKLLKTLKQLENSSIPEDFTLYSNLDRGRVKYINNRIWDFDLNIYHVVHEGEDFVFFNYDGDEEPGISIKFETEVCVR